MKFQVAIYRLDGPFKLQIFCFANSNECSVSGQKKFKWAPVEETSTIEDT